MALVIVLNGCATQKSADVTASGESVATALGSQRRPMPADLQRQADREQSKATATGSVTDVPTPPGVEPELLAERTAGWKLAQLGLGEALQVLAEQDVAAGQSKQTGGVRSDAERAKPHAAGDEQSDAQDIDAAARDEALRHYARGRDAALQRRHLAAVTQFMKALELTPKDTDVLRALARSYLGLGNQSKSIQTYREILSLEPGHSEAVFMIALASADRREFETAARLLSGKKLADGGFDHDPAADVLADYVLSVALAQLGYDRASIEAARSAIDGVETSMNGSLYSARLGSVYRQRGEIQRSIGDAYCRLGEYANALRAYERSSELPAPDPMALAPRVLYANLRLGRVHTTQLELYAALAADAPDVSERLVRLCEYVAAHVDDLEALRKAMLELRGKHPADASLARSAAALLPEDRALALMRRFAVQHPDSASVIGEILSGLADRDVREAVEFAAAVVDEQPTLAEETVKRLFMATSRPSDAVRAAREAAGSAAMAVVEARLLLHMGALGPAWSAAQQADAQHAAPRALHVTRLEIAAHLEEPSLLDTVIETWPGELTGAVLLEQSRALRRAGQPDKALLAAERAQVRGADEFETLIELAWAHIAVGAQQEDQNVAQVHGQDAVQYAEQAIELRPDDDRPYRVLTAVYGSGGPLEDATKLRETARRLFDANPDSRLYAQLVVEESLSRRRYEKALEGALNLYETDPWDRASLRMAIEAWRQMDRMGDAARWLDRKLEDQPGNPHLLEQWTSVQLAMNRPEQALQRLEAHVERDPLDYAATYLLESAYRAANRVDKAIELAEQRLLSRPLGIRRELELASLYAQGKDFEAAMQRVEHVVERIDEATRRQLIAAVSLVQRIDEAQPKRTDLLLRLVEEATQRFDRLPLDVYGPALVALAGRGASEGEFESMARRAVDDVAKRDGGGVQAALAWREVAQQLVDAGRPGLAGQILELRLLTEPRLTDDRAHAALCMMTFAANAAAGGRADESLSLLSTLQQDGELPVWPGYDQQASLSESLYELSQMYYLIGDQDGAMVILEQLVRLQPDHAMALNNLGYFRIERGDDSARVAQMIERAHELRPDEANVIDSMGWLRYKQGRFGDKATADDDGNVNEQGDRRQGAGDMDDQPGALEYLMRAVKASAEPSAESLDHLGDAQWRLGMTDEAVTSWRRAVDLLENELWQRQMVSVYEFMMQRQWLLVVADPQAMYDREFGATLERTRAKLEAAANGVRPPVAPTFAELTGPDTEARRRDGDR